MAEAVVINRFREKIARHMYNESPLPRIRFMAFGDGGHNSDLSPKAMDPARESLYNERLRKELNNIMQEDSMSVTGIGRLERDELVGAQISEIGLLDANGDLIGFRCFSPKIKDVDETYEVELKIRF
ncbi:phage tail protein [Acetomicrobium sp. S15 = DSM 107314]|uniref:phage tail protein n=1 Tax=Acetomicrobium sp. S15 = DSM 107314 TaxID=2529858 RepID=UPI0018E0E6B6|nr:phage tail protein [Acetomicrobium sp. S15 = DSM 107314]